MKNKVRYTAQALHDLDEVWDYISFELQNPQAAEKTVNRILDKVDQLVEFAQSGALLSAVSEVMGEERFLVCDSYMIFYHSEKQEVTIDRVLYGRRDYLRVLFDKTELPEQEASKTPGGGTSPRVGAAAFCLFREIQGTLRSQR